MIWQHDTKGRMIFPISTSSAWPHSRNKRGSRKALGLEVALLRLEVEVALLGLEVALVAGRLGDHRSREREKRGCRENKTKRGREKQQQRGKRQVLASRLSPVPALVVAMTWQ
jgi:hypothetical protein